MNIIVWQEISVFIDDIFVSVRSGLKFVDKLEKIINEPWGIFQYFLSYNIATKPNETILGRKQQIFTKNKKKTPTKYNEAVYSSAVSTMAHQTWKSGTGNDRRNRQ